MNWVIVAFFAMLVIGIALGWFAGWVTARIRARRQSTWQEKFVRGLAGATPSLSPGVIGAKRTDGFTSRPVAGGDPE